VGEQRQEVDRIAAAPPAGGAAQQAFHVAPQAELRRVGMGQREQVAAVEQGRAAQARGDIAAQEVPHVAALVRDQRATPQRGRQLLGDLVDSGRSGEIRRPEARRASLRGRERAARPNPGPQPGRTRSAAIEQDDVQLQDLRRAGVRGAADQKVDDRQRTEIRHEGGELIEPVQLRTRPDRSPSEALRAHINLECLTTRSDPRRPSARGPPDRRAERSILRSIGPSVDLRTDHT
jgi:hypothetical protein